MERQLDLTELMERLNELPELCIGEPVLKVTLDTNVNCLIAQLTLRTPSSVRIVRRSISLYDVCMSRNQSIPINHLLVPLTNNGIRYNYEQRRMERRITGC